jgi:hypothetical protein
MVKKMLIQRCVRSDAHSVVIAHHHHHHAMVLTSNRLNIEKLVWGGRVGGRTFCSVRKAAPERKDARSYATTVCKEQTRRDYF